ncbi:protease, conjectural [Pyrobaculum aerophilum str. IM2]|uniref:Protease, conjectural n=1 Tax=Pyrobaculum aerophilum (strain ATCC 51768 / DSM 7523 / JCM 9630 / CIP 104966 / NBRC 100827 / IM2) TaxID=178306 RepID=Q8ZWL5_PYRAE|nr:protease [Pyrobaculum aerophilum]AAL63686.1 protease, conjectural [Pyrobaculum aerophilum str. IM2]
MPKPGLARLGAISALVLAAAAYGLSLTDRWNDLAGGVQIEVGYDQTPDRYFTVGYCSLGVAVYWYESGSRVFGYLTAGHCTNSQYQDAVYQPYRNLNVGDNNYIGTVIRDSYYSGTTPVIDAALIKIEASSRTVRPWIATSAVGFQTDALVNWYYTIVNAPQDPGGSRYSKLGYRCGYDWGLKIDKVTYVIDENGIIALVYRLIKDGGGRINACQGDSGGPVFYMWSQRIDSMVVYYANVLGLIKGVNDVSNPTAIYVTPIDEALNRLQVYLYTL